MSGRPTQVEIENQWRAVIDIFEPTRLFADATLADAAGKYDTLTQAIEGEYTPALIDQMVDHRALMDAALAPGRVRAMLEPIFREYASQVLTDGAGFASIEDIMRAVYEFLADVQNDGATPRRIESRAIAFDASTSSSNGRGGAIVGSGLLSRLTVDEWGYEIEDATPERKYIRCRQDQNSGVKAHGEIFEVVGDPLSPDNLLRTATRLSGGTEVYGSGVDEVLRSRHSASDSVAGSLLTNSSFDEFTAGTPNTMRGWTIASGAANLSQDTTNFFRTFPNATNPASLKATGNFKITQALTAMNTRELNANSPYFLRLMYNRSIDSGTGTLTIKLGKLAVTTIVMSAEVGWNQITYGIDKDLWFRNFTEDAFDIEIEVSGFGGTAVYFDDAIFARWTQVNRTWWMMTGGDTAFLVDDTFIRQDTGGAPPTAKLQYYTQLAGLGYLPHTTGVPEIAEP